MSTENQSIQASVLPKPVVKRRVLDLARYQLLIDHGVPALKAHIMASRKAPLGIEVVDSLKMTLSDLDSPEQMADMSLACARLVQAIQQGEHIALETDHDCDGQTSHAVLYEALTTHFNHPKTHVHSFIGHRLNEGYGLSEALKNRILAHEPRPSLVITADNGSSDEERIADLKKAGIDVIVTDHHEIPNTGIPKSAYAVLNPTREDCAFPDTLIAGCMVAWLFMAATRKKLLEAGHSMPSSSIVQLLDFVAVGTIADCVSMARSKNNRIVVNKGLQLIATMERCCWRAVKPLCQGQDILSEDLGFVVGPLLNSDGRLDSALGSVSFLLAQTDESAQLWVQHLQEQNQERKSIQNKITADSVVQAIPQYQANKRSLCIYLADGHSGVHGISASRIKDQFGRPTFVFSPKLNAPDLITGSGRSIDHFHLRDALQAMMDADPTLMIAFGGHQGAAGATLPKTHFEKFSEAFEKQCLEKLNPKDVGPVIWSDGPIDVSTLDLFSFAKLHRSLQPFGREFENPSFEVEASVTTYRLIGDKTHAIVNLNINGKIFKAMWFKLKANPQEPDPVVVGQQGLFLVSPKIEYFMNNAKLILHIEHYFGEFKN